MGDGKAPRFTPVRSHGGLPREGEVVVAIGVSVASGRSRSTVRNDVPECDRRELEKTEGLRGTEFEHRRCELRLADGSSEPEREH